MRYKLPKLTKPIGRSDDLYTLCEETLVAFKASGGKFIKTKYTPVKLSTGVIYYLQLKFSDVTLYKLGYTSRTVWKRVETLGVPANCSVKVLAALPFTSVQTAFNVEQLLHERFKEFRYKGKDRLGNGNSELYIRPLL